LAEQSFDLFAAFFVYACGARQIGDEFLGFIEDEENVGFDLESSFSPG